MKTTIEISQMYYPLKMNDGKWYIFVRTEVPQQMKSRKLWVVDNQERAEEICQVLNESVE